jgi:peptidyl-prolyl cis-trans isomerase SurA
MKYIKLITTVAFLLVPSIGVAQISNVYGTAISVNDRVITHFELLQRAQMLQLFGAKGDLQASAQNALIEERLYLQAGKELGVLPSEGEIQAGMDEFSARGKLSTDQLIEVLKSRGVARESYHAFIEAGLTWRKVVGARFANQTRVTDDDIDAALSFQNGAGQMDFLLSEIILSEGQRGTESADKLALRLSRSIKGTSGFASAARSYSGSPSARKGGRLDWVPGRSLPANIVAQLLTLQPGQVTGPITLNGNIALFQLRSSRKSKGAVQEPDILSYVSVILPFESDAKRAAAKARVLRSGVDTCLDMRAAAQKAAGTFGEGAGTTQEVPAHIALALANLDPKETTTITQSNGQLNVVMLCTRNQELIEGERETIRESLFSQKVANLGAGYLQELKGDAFIVYK